GLQATNNTQAGESWAAGGDAYFQGTGPQNKQSCRTRTIFFHGDWLSVILVIFPRGLIHPLKQVATCGCRSSPKVALWVAYPLQQRFGPSSRKPIGGSPLIQSTIGMANPSPSELFRASSTPVGGNDENYPQCDLRVGHVSGLARRRFRGRGLYSGLELGRSDCERRQ